MTASSIPIRNIYYLLAYAWDYFRGGPQLDVATTDCPDVHNLLATVLAAGIRRLSTAGMDKKYQSFWEETSQLRGRIRMLSSHRRLLQQTGRLECEFDELTADTSANQILRATCRRLLLCSSQLTLENRKIIRRSFEVLDGVTDVRLDRRLFARVQLHRNTRHYRLLMDVCRLLHELYLPAQTDGGHRFQSLLDDEVRMHRIFEAFVRRFAQQHCSNLKVSSTSIRWQGEWSTEVSTYLPSMQTDLTIEGPARKAILDCKYYREALVSHHNRHRLHSGHLYQLMSYLRNQSSVNGWQAAHGILLYPANSHQVNLHFQLWGHAVSIRSLDLDQEWSCIHSDLIGILC